MDIESLRRRVEQAKATHAQAQQDAAAKAAVVETLLSQLREEFGCGTVAEGQALLATLDQKSVQLAQRVQELLAAVEQGLEEVASANAGGTGRVRAAAV